MNTPASNQPRAAGEAAQPAPLTLKDVKRLKVGDKLTWDHKEPGEVIETGYLGAKIKWADGQITVLFFSDIEGDVAEVMERLAKIRRASK